MLEKQDLPGKQNKLVITEMSLNGTSCLVCAFSEGERVAEIRIEPKDGGGILGNIYVGQVDKVSKNIQAAFVRFAEGQTGYLPLKEAETAIFADGRKNPGASGAQAQLRPGDQLLVQVSRDAMKMKLPALSTNLNFPGKYLVLTTGNKRIGYSKKLSKEDSAVLHKWMEEAAFSELVSDEEARKFGLVVRTNAAEAQKEDFLFELAYLKKLWTKAAVDGIHRTLYSKLYEAEPFYVTAVRDVYSHELGEIVTDVPEIYEKIQNYLTDFKPDELGKLRHYADKLLPLYKLYSLERVIDEIWHEKVWLKSGGFLMIQQTEAFVSIDVNSGKYMADKKAEETFRKINLEAAGEIARQIRLRNLSGIILIDFINMQNPDHREELFHVLQKILRKDPVKTKAVDFTQLQILEVTRKKVRRPVMEVLLELKKF